MYVFKFEGYENRWGLTAVTKRLYRVIQAYMSPYPDSIFFQKGETVTVGKKFSEDPDWQNWVWCEGTNGKKAWVPESYLDFDGRNGTFNRDYDAKELTVKAGETLAVYEVVNGFGMSEKQDGTRGWVPMKNMQIEE